MSKIIIGVHVLRKKPPKKQLERWWKAAIREGLKNIRRPHLFIPFELVYWADFLYEKPLNPKEQDPDSPYYIEFPYIKGSTGAHVDTNSFRQKMLEKIEKVSDFIFFKKDMSPNFSGLTDLILKRFFKDLFTYYDGYALDHKKKMQPAKQVIREQLAHVVDKHRNKEILLIGHSMGSIIAFDVLAHTRPDIKVHTLLTMGSPLGLPAVAGRIVLESTPLTKLTTPENITHQWFNLSDLYDNVAFNYNLKDDYEKNRHGVQAIDLIVSNNYEYKDKKNPHKSYGYLRSTECANIIDMFLDQDKNRFSKALTKGYQKLVNRLFLS